MFISRSKKALKTGVVTYFKGGITWVTKSKLRSGLYEKVDSF